MAIGIFSDLVIRDELFEAAFIETVGQSLATFNEASNNALRIVTMDMEGHFGKTRFMDRPTDLVSRRDISSTSDATDTNLTMDEQVSVKVNRKIGPKAQTIDSLIKAGASSETLSVRLGQLIGEAVLEDYVNTSLNVLEACLSQYTSTNPRVYDHTGTGDLEHSALNAGLNLFGDARNRVVCWVGHSKAYNDLIGDSLTAASGQLAETIVYGGAPGTFGRPFVVTDSSYLLLTGTPDDYVTLGLVQNALVLTESEARRIVAQVVTGKENLIVRYQGEYAYNVEVKGHSWKEATGNNPTDAALGTASNWVEEVASHKDGPGVYVKTT